MKGRKTTLYIVFLIALLLPLWQMHTRFFHEPVLKGTCMPHEKPSLTAKSWFDGSFQSDFEKYINDTLGFHPHLVQLRNIFCYKMFRQTSAQNVVIGKDSYLFEQDYIDAHYGTDYVGGDSIVRQVRRIRALQDQLAAKGKTLVLFLAPNKADFFPEYIPYALQKAETDSTNYKQYSKLLKQNGVNVIDYNAYYLSQKSNSPYPLYAQYGIHWSKYGLTLATDSLVRYIAHISGLQLPKLVVDRYVISPKQQYSDFDLGVLLNLPDKYLPGYPMCYPEVHWTADTASPKPMLTVIADSYYWEVFNLDLQRLCFQGNFWYYNTIVYPESFTKETRTSELNMKKEIEKTDVILIMSTAPGLKFFSWGAVENLLKAL